MATDHILHGPGPDDALEVAVNGVVLEGEVRRSSEGWKATVSEGTDPEDTAEQHIEGEWLEFDLPAPPLRSGANEVRVALHRGEGETPRRETISLAEVRLMIDYHENHS